MWSKWYWWSIWTYYWVARLRWKIFHSCRSYCWKQVTIILLVVQWCAMKLNFHCSPLPWYTLLYQPRALTVIMSDLQFLFYVSSVSGLPILICYFFVQLVSCGGWKWRHINQNNWAPQCTERWTGDICTPEQGESSASYISTEFWCDTSFKKNEILREISFSIWSGQPYVYLLA